METVDQIPTLAATSSPRSHRLSRHTSNAAPNVDAVTATRLLLRQSMSKQRLVDPDLLPDPLSGASTTAGNSTDDSDTEREAKDRMQPVGARTRFSQGGQKLGGKDLAVPTARRLHNLSVDSAVYSDEERRRASSGSPKEGGDAVATGRRQRLHLRTTSRDLQPFDVNAFVVRPQHEEPVPEEDRRQSTGSRRSGRRFTKTRHSNAFEGDVPRTNRLSRYDSTGDPNPGSRSISISAYEDGRQQSEEKIVEGGGRLGNTQLVIPVMSSSSSDESISPVWPLGHKRTVSSAGQRTSRFAAPLSPSQAGTSLSPKSRRLSLYRLTSRGKKLALLLSASPLTRSLHSVALHKMGYTVLTATTVGEAVELACAQRMEVVMVDWADGGEEVVKGIRAVEAERGDDCTVIVATVEEAMDEATKRNSQQAGCSAVVEDAAQIHRLLPDIIQQCQSGPTPFVYAAADASPPPTVSPSS